MCIISVCTSNVLLKLMVILGDPLSDYEPVCTDFPRLPEYRDHRCMSTRLCNGIRIACDVAVTSTAR